MALFSSEMTWGGYYCTFSPHGHTVIYHYNYPSPISSSMNTRGRVDVGLCDVSLPLRTCRQCGWVGPGVGGFRELVGESGLDPSTDADLEELVDPIIPRQVGDVGFACGSTSAALAAAAVLGALSQ